MFSRKLNDALPSNPKDIQLRPEWILTAQAREKALSCRHLARHDDLSNSSKPLKPLAIHQIVQVQNQCGSHANKWDLCGTIVQVLGHDAYIVKMDGSGRTTKRNRRFLKPILPFNEQLRHRTANNANNNLSTELVRSTDTSSPVNSSDKSDDSTMYSNTGPTADSREASSLLLQSQPQTDQQPAAAPKSGYKRVAAPDTQKQSVRITNERFDDSLNPSVQRVQNVHQYKDKQPEAASELPDNPTVETNTRSKQVKFATKRYI